MYYEKEKLENLPFRIEMAIRQREYEEQKLDRELKQLLDEKGEDAFATEEMKKQVKERERISNEMKLLRSLRVVGYQEIPQGMYPNHFYEVK